METFNEYQDFTKSLAVYNDMVILEGMELQEDGTLVPVSYWQSYMYPVLALSEEAGEVAGKVAKFIRKSSQGHTSDDVRKLRADVEKELGDVLYAVSEVARKFQLTLQDVVDMNVEKLTSRKERGVLVGEGDNR